MIGAVTVSDPNARLAAGVSDQLVRLVQAAGDMWKSALGTTRGGLDVQVQITTETARAEAGSAYSKLLGTFAGTEIWLLGAAYELTTGNDGNGAGSDIVIKINPDYLSSTYWISPLDGSATPANKVDLLTTLAHEIGHALGFNGSTSQTTYTKGAQQTTFDTLITVIDGQPYFTGQNAQKVFGGPVPLTPGNVFHTGSTIVGPDMINDLMNGVGTKVGPRSGPSELNVAMMSDLGLPTAYADFLSGAEQADNISGGRGNDTITGRGGNDTLDGGDGFDVAVYSGPASAYTVTRTGNVWTVADNRAGSPDGTDQLTNIENLKFSDQEVFLQLTPRTDLAGYMQNVLRYSTDYVKGAALVQAANSQRMDTPDGLKLILSAAPAATSVATLSYEFFTGKTPSSAGLDYLLQPNGPNSNNINSAYYQNFNLENRYINFAVNLGKLGEGKDAFAAKYTSLSLFDATREAYKTIFGGTPTDAKVHTLIDSRTDYFAFYGADGANGIGTKAAMVGWLLAEAVKAGVGMYAEANKAYLLDLADGTAPFNIDLVGVYGDPDYAYAG